MKTFDFNHEDFKSQCVAKQNFVKDNHDKPLTEEQFVNAIQDMPKHKHWSRGHSPSNAKYEYHRLIERFGFFPDEQKG